MFKKILALILVLLIPINSGISVLAATNITNNSITSWTDYTVYSTYHQAQSEIEAIIYSNNHYIYFPLTSPVAKMSTGGVTSGIAFYNSSSVEIAYYQFNELFTGAYTGNTIALFGWHKLDLTTLANYTTFSYMQIRFAFDSGGTNWTNLYTALSASDGLYLVESASNFDNYLNTHSDASVYSNGFEDGYDEGYLFGYNVGAESSPTGEFNALMTLASTFLGVILNTIQTVFLIEVFGVNLLDILGLFLGIFLLLLLWRILKGGRG